MMEEAEWEKIPEQIREKMGTLHTRDKAFKVDGKILFKVFYVEGK